MSDQQLPGNGDVRITLATLSLQLHHVLEGQMAQAQEVREARAEMIALRRLVDAVPVVVERAIDDKLERFVTIDQFSPVRAIVYGLVSMVGVALIGALMAIVLGGAHP